MAELPDPFGNTECISDEHIYYITLLHLLQVYFTFYFHTHFKKATGAMYMSVKKSCIFLFSAASFFLIVLFSHLSCLHTVNAFQNLTKHLFQEEVASSTLTLHYTLRHPQIYGISDIPVRYDTNSDLSAAESYLKQLNALDASRLSFSDQITYDSLIYQLNQTLASQDFSGYAEPLGATIGIQAQLPVLLCEYRFDSLSDVHIYLQLLSTTDQYFAGLLAYEREKASAGLFMPDSCAENIISQCHTFIQGAPSEHLLVTVFNRKIDALDFLTSTEKQQLQEQNFSIVTSHVLPAYRLLASGLNALKISCHNQMGLYYLPKGRIYYEHLVKASTGSALSVSSIQNRIQKQLLSDAADCRMLLEYCTDSDMLSSLPLPDTPEEILSDLRQKMQADFPDTPSASCTLKYVDGSLSSYLSPAFYLTAPVDDLNENVIYLNPSADYTALELYTTLAHEGYPGHLYQNLYSGSVLSPIRSLLSFGGYTEGWATYVEMFSYSYASEGLPENFVAAISLEQKQRSMMLGLSSLTDILVHYRGFSRDEIRQFFSSLGISSPQAADTLYDAVLEAPANYLKYYLGFLSFQDLQDYCRKNWPEQFSLSGFHRYVLEIGPCPFPVLEKYLKLCYTHSL